MELKWKIHKWDFAPTADQLKAIEAAEYSIMELKRGMFIPWVGCRINTAFNGTTPKIQIGTSHEADGYVLDDVIGGVGHGATPELYSSMGHYVCPSFTQYYRPVWNQTQIDALDNPQMILTYTGADDTTTGSLSVIVVYCEIE